MWVYKLEEKARLAKSFHVEYVITHRLITSVFCRAGKPTTTKGVWEPDVQLMLSSATGHFDKASRAFAPLTHGQPL